MTISPETTYALVVGIEKYAESSEWDIDGPVHNACQFAQWLRERGVPEEHILLFLSPLDKSSHLIEELGAEPATREHIRHALFRFLPQKQDGMLLYVFWGGHGFVTINHPRLLFYADATWKDPLNLDLDALLISLRSSDLFKNFVQQIYLVDACGTYIKDRQRLGNGPIPTEGFPTGNPDSARQQYVLLASKAGEYAKNLTAQRTGLFSAELLEALAVTDPTVWPLDMDTISSQLKNRFKQLRTEGLASQTPIVWCSDWDGNVESFGNIPSNTLFPPHRGNRIRMLNKVRKTWIDGLLAKSLQHASRIELHLQDYSDLHGNPWQQQVQELDQFPERLSDGTILQAYDRAEGELLILGEPGSGKTTLLLELTSALLDRAEKDELLSMPIVFNLSSWTEKYQALSLWLLEELWTKYQVPLKVGQGWIETDQILPILDGLDEVAHELRTSCVQQINDYYHFRLERGISSMVVCCRTQEYISLDVRVMLEYAVRILPLTDEQIDLYLKQSGMQVIGLRQALNEDAELHSLARQPLMLNIFSLAYQGAAANELPRGKTREGAQYTIFARYVERMFKRRKQLKRWTQEEMVRWLVFLAQQMQLHNQPFFTVENLQPTWLSSYFYNTALLLTKKFLTFLEFGLLGGLALGIDVGLTSGLLAGITYGAIGGLMVGIAGFVFIMRNDQSGNEIEKPYGEPILPIEQLGWSWGTAWLSISRGLINGIVSGLLNGFIISHSTWNIEFFQYHGLIYGSLLAGIFAGVMIPRNFRVASQNKLVEDARLRPNEGIWRSFKHGITGGLIMGLACGLTTGLIMGLFSGLIAGLAIGCATIFCVWFASSYIFGLEAFIAHFVLRFLLWRKGYLPWKLIAFLDEATNRLLLRKVGRSYIFVHKLLLEHFSTSDEFVSTEDTSQEQPLAALMLENVPALWDTIKSPLRLDYSNPYFVGREKVFKQLATITPGNGHKHPPVIVINGISGIGKKRLINEFIQRYEQKFTGGVFWLDFATTDTALTSLSMCYLALRAEMPLADIVLPRVEQAQAVKQVWEKSLPRLLIFEHCEDEALLKLWLPVTGECSIILLSNKTRWSTLSNVKRIVVGKLAEDESIQLLQSSCPDILPAIAKELASFAEGLPQALYVMGQYLSEGKSKPDAYLDLLKKGQTKNHIDEIFLLSYKKLDAQKLIDKKALELLFLVIHLEHGELIPYELLYSLFFYKQKPSSHEEKVFEDALCCLENIGFLELYRSYRLLRVNDLICKFIKAQIESETHGQIARPIQHLQMKVIRIFKQFITDETLIDTLVQKAYQYLPLFQKHVAAIARQIQLGKKDSFVLRDN